MTEFESATASIDGVTLHYWLGGNAEGQPVLLVAKNVEGGVIADCGHFVPEERPEEVVRYIAMLNANINER